MSPIDAHKTGLASKQPYRGQEQQLSHSKHDHHNNNNFMTTSRHIIASPGFISDSLKWLRWHWPEVRSLDEPAADYFTAPMNLLVTIKSRYQQQSYFKKISPPSTHKPHHHLLPVSLLYYSTLLALLILNLGGVEESHGNPAPSGFFISGHAIPCTVGQPVDILDHIPFADPSLRKCYGCSCPAGSVVCDKLKDQSNCDYQRPSAAVAVKTPVASSSSSKGSIKHNAISNRVASPTSATLLHSHHLHHHGHSVLGMPSGGKAKGLGVPRKVKTNGDTSSGQAPHVPLQQPPVAQQQQQHKKQSVGTPRSLRTSPVPPGNEVRNTRNHHYYGSNNNNRHHTSRHIVAQVDQGQEEFRGLRETMRPPTPYPYVAEILQTPSMPVDDPRHLEHAAAAFNLPLAEFKRIHDKNKKKSSDRQTPTTTTTPEPTTTTATPFVEEPTEESTGAQDADQSTTTFLDATTTTTISSTTPQEETTTTQAPETTITWTGSEEDQLATTTEKPNLGLESGEQQPGGDIPVDNDRTVFIEQDNQTRKPDLDLSPPAIDSSPPISKTTTTTLDVLTNHIDNNQHQPNLMIDNQQANEIMEQVSHDGILYIAIGVEAFILMSIIIMMIIFYLFREKTPPDELPQFHQALQMPRRSPSLEKA